MDQAVDERAEKTAWLETPLVTPLPAAPVEAIAHNLNALLIRYKRSEGRKATNQEDSSTVWSVHPCLLWLHHPMIVDRMVLMIQVRASVGMTIHITLPSRCHSCGCSPKN